jgi:hypothetical protein
LLYWCCTIIKSRCEITYLSCMNHFASPVPLTLTAVPSLSDWQTVVGSWFLDERVQQESICVFDFPYHSHPNPMERWTSGMEAVQKVPSTSISQIRTRHREKSNRSSSRRACTSKPPKSSAPSATKKSRNTTAN